MTVLDRVEYSSEIGMNGDRKCCAGFLCVDFNSIAMDMLTTKSHRIGATKAGEQQDIESNPLGSPIFPEFSVQRDVGFRPWCIAQ